jgi:dCMP deaminase
LVASWSKDPSSKFGAVIVDKQNRVVALGFNGFASGFEDTEERWNDRQFKYRHVIHAEEQAILHAKVDLSDCRVYIQAPPCSSCMSKIAQSGIKQVICRSPSEDYLSRWSVDEPMQVAKECGVTVTMLD